MSGNGNIMLEHPLKKGQDILIELTDYTVSVIKYNKIILIVASQRGYD